MLNIKKLLTKILSSQVPVEYTDYTLPLTVEMTIAIHRAGNVVSITIVNPTKMANQNNDILTLPVGWRPVHNVVFMLNAPSATGVTNQTLRMTINATTGLMQIYNYSGSAISSSTNIAQTCTYICSPK